MAQRGRPPSSKTLVDRQLGRNVQNPILPTSDGFVVPNYSGVDNYIRDVAGDVWLRITGGTMTGDLNMGSRNISNVRDLALDTISTDVDFGTQKITGTGTLAWTGVGHDTFSDFVANEHIDWTSATNNFSTTGTLSVDNSVVFNESGADKDFRVEGDTEPNLLFVDASTERVGIGTATPQSTLHVFDDGGGDKQGIIRAGGTSSGLGSVFQYSALSSGRLSITQLNDGGGFNATLAFGFGAVSGGFPSRTIMTVTQNGRIGILTKTPVGVLSIDQSNAGGTLPVLILDQADVSEELIEFVSTIGTGNAIEAVGSKTLTTTHFIRVTIPGGLYRYIPVGTIA